MNFHISSATEYESSSTCTEVMARQYKALNLRFHPANEYSLHRRYKQQVHKPLQRRSARKVHTPCTITQRHLTNASYQVPTWSLTFLLLTYTILFYLARNVLIFTLGCPLFSSSLCGADMLEYPVSKLWYTLQNPKKDQSFVMSRGGCI